MKNITILITLLLMGMRAIEADAQIYNNSGFQDHEAMRLQFDIESLFEECTNDPDGNSCDLINRYSQRVLNAIDESSYAPLEFSNGLYVKNNNNLGSDKTEDEQEHALKVEGNMHIGNGYSFDDSDSEYPTKLNLIGFLWRPEVKLAVEDGIASENLIYVYKQDWDEWPDYVFENSYHLPSLQEVKAFVSEHKHLPGVPSQQKVKMQGVNDKRMTEILLKKTEELSLYVIDQHKEIASQRTLHQDVEKRIQDLSFMIISLEDKNEMK